MRWKLAFWAFMVLLLGGVATWFVYGSRIRERVLTRFRNPSYEVTEVVGEILPTAVLSPDPVLGYKMPGSGVLLPGARWVPQTFNNCGPATTSMVLQYFGYNVGQEETKSKLRTSPNDSNVFAEEISGYLKTFGIEAPVFYNGDLQLIKVLLSNGFYVMLETWLHPYEDIGHVTVIRGFDDEKGVLIADDSYIGTGITYKYEEFDVGQWKAFNREYLPIYRPEKQKLLQAIIGENLDSQVMYQGAVKRNNEDVRKDERDMYAWFNLGSSYYALGEYQKAKAAFERSRGLGWPRRMLWYQIQPIKTYNKLGEYQRALELISLGLASNDSFAELHLEAAIAYRGLGNLSRAREEVNQALTYYPGMTAAEELLRSL